MNPDTRVALVREDRSTLVRLTNAIYETGASSETADRHAAAILAELFPETDKSLKAKHLQAITAPFDGSERWASLEDIRDGASRIEEELNRG